VTDACLQFLTPTQRGVARVGHDVNDRNSIQPNHLLEVHVSAVIPVDVVHGQTEIGSIGVGLEDVSPVGIWGLGKSNMQENGAGS